MLDHPTRSFQPTTLNFDLVFAAKPSPCSNLTSATTDFDRTNPSVRSLFTLLEAKNSPLRRCPPSNVQQAKETPFRQLTTPRFTTFRMLVPSVFPLFFRTADDSLGRPVCRGYTPQQPGRPICRGYTPQQPVGWAARATLGALLYLQRGLSRGSKIPHTWSTPQVRRLRTAFRNNRGLSFR